MSRAAYVRMVIPTSFDIFFSRKCDRDTEEKQVHRKMKQDEKILNVKHVMVFALNGLERPVTCTQKCVCARNVFIVLWEAYLP